jgi:hypothetical protein
MNRNTTLILVGVFAALLLYVLLVQRPADEARANATPTSGASTTGSVWGTLTADQVLSLRIEDRAGGRVVAFGRASASAAWEVTEPEARPADQLTAATNVGSAANLTYQSSLEPTTELSAFGVVSPTYTIAITLVDGSTIKGFVGNKTPVGDGYYVAKEGSGTVMVVSNFTLDALLKLLDEPPYLQPTQTPAPVETPTSLPTP